MAFKFKSFVGLFLFGIFMSVGSAHANISTVGYVHDTILSQKGITIPIDSGVNRDQPHSVKYLMRQIDAANLENGNTTTYATTANQSSLVSTTKTAQDVTNLIEERSFKLTIANTNLFEFVISASGNFKINWGDGNIDTITKPDTDGEIYSHTYDSVGSYVVKLSGKATGYASHYNTSAITFGSDNYEYNSPIEKIEGSLGHIFSTLGDGTNPRFYLTFGQCIKLTGSIPSDLFAGISGTPVENMFALTFSECTGLTGSIPSGLFSGITGTPASYMFSYTFYNCTGLTGSIPSGLFGNLSGEPAEHMFDCTFEYCGGLTGSIPSGLFSNIYGTPAYFMFNCTFYECIGLTGSIPSGLFGIFTGDPAEYMFSGTFYGCSRLDYISDGIWDLSGLNDSNVQGMFSGTFSGCNNISGESPSIKAGSNTKLWEHFTSYSGDHAFSSAISMYDYFWIPAGWK